MRAAHVILGSRDSKTIALCQKVAKEIGARLTVKHSALDFLLALQENDFRVAIFDGEQTGGDSLRWIRLIRRLRPKIPLIVFLAGVDRKTGGKIYQESVFHVLAPPVHENMFRQVVLAALRCESLDRSTS